MQYFSNSTSLWTISLRYTPKDIAFDSPSTAISYLHLFVKSSNTYLHDMNVIYRILFYSDYYNEPMWISPSFFLKDLVKNLDLLINQIVPKNPSLVISIGT